MLVSIVFDSGYGHTAQQAHAVAEGVGNVPGAEAELIAVSDGPVAWETLEASDVKWRDKVAAGFTNSGAQNGDKLNSLISMALFAAQHGMIWVGLDLKPVPRAARSRDRPARAWARMRGEPCP